MEIENVLSKYPIPEIERQVYALDQRINDRGAMLDMQLVEDIIEYNDEYRASLLERAKKRSRD